MSYYDEHQNIAQVDQKDTLIGQIDKWQAHKDGVLHRAFTVCLFFKGKILLQHRKHPVFDGVFDLTCSSHPIYVKDRLQELDEAAYLALKREWNIAESSLLNGFQNKGYVYYEAQDNRSIYKEHEICYLLTGEIKTVPALIETYAYGYSLVEKESLIEETFPLRKSFAPWVFPLLKLI